MREQNLLQLPVSPLHPGVLRFFLTQVRFSRSRTCVCEETKKQRSSKWQPVFLPQVIPMYCTKSENHSAFCRNQGYPRVYSWPIVCIAQMMSIWYTVIISSERFLAICYPLQVRYPPFLWCRQREWKAGMVWAQFKLRQFSRWHKLVAWHIACPVWTGHQISRQHTHTHTTSHHTLAQCLETKAERSFLRRFASQFNSMFSVDLESDFRRISKSADWIHFYGFIRCSKNRHVILVGAKSGELSVTELMPSKWGSVFPALTESNINWHESTWTWLQTEAIQFPEIPKSHISRCKNSTWRKGNWNGTKINKLVCEPPIFSTGASKSALASTDTRQ